MASSRPARSAGGGAGAPVAPPGDRDGDGALDLYDDCPDDPAKVEPGPCGCGLPDTDTDGDGLIYCQDNCPAVPNPSQEDANSDHVGDACDLCPNTPPGGRVASNGCAPPGFDHDEDVDLGDFSGFQACFNGPNRPYAADCAVAADVDGDADVDLVDFVTFQSCYNGPNRPPRCM